MDIHVEMNITYINKNIFVYIHIVNAGTSHCHVNFRGKKQISSLPQGAFDLPKFFCVNVMKIHRDSFIPMECVYETRMFG